MDGNRLQKYWSKDVEALLATYKQFQELIPAKNIDGSAHNGEDGRYVETLLREYLKKYLPKELEVLTGFILRPAVKKGTNDRSRKGQNDEHSTQIDIIVYDSYKYPIFQRFGDSVIVPPEGVIAIISVKKHFHDSDIEKELGALKAASELCRDGKTRGPYISLISMKSKIQEKKTITQENWIFNICKEIYEKEDNYFDNLVGYIGSLSEWSIFKKRPAKMGECATYVYMKHHDDEAHLGLQFLLTGILSVYYDKSRNSKERPGFTAFPSGRSHDATLGKIITKGLR